MPPQGMGDRDLAGRINKVFQCPVKEIRGGGPIQKIDCHVRKAEEETDWVDEYQLLDVLGKGGGGPSSDDGAERMAGDGAFRDGMQSKDLCKGLHGFNPVRGFKRQLRDYVGDFQQDDFPASTQPREKGNVEPYACNGAKMRCWREINAKVRTASLTTIEIAVENKVPV